MKGELEHTKRVSVGDLTVWGYGCDRGMVGTAGTPNELANPAHRIRNAGRRLGGKAFIDVVVTGEDQVGIVVIKYLPKRQRVLCGASAGAE